MSEYDTTNPVDAGRPLEVLVVDEVAPLLKHDGATEQQVPLIADLLEHHPGLTVPAFPTRAEGEPLGPPTGDDAEMSAASTTVPAATAEQTTATAAYAAAHSFLSLLHTIDDPALRTHFAEQLTTRAESLNQSLTGSLDTTALRTALRCELPEALRLHVGLEATHTEPRPGDRAVLTEILIEARRLITLADWFGGFTVAPHPIDDSAVTADRAYADALETAMTALEHAGALAATYAEESAR